MNAPQISTLTASRAARVQHVVSKAGLEAWLVEDYAVPLVAMEFALEGGSTQDPDGRMGAASMMAGLMDEGAGDLDAQAFHNALDDKAIEISFSSDSDSFHGRLKTMSRNIDAAFALLKLAVNQPRFDRDAIERVRAQCWQAFAMKPMILMRSLAKPGVKWLFRAMPMAALRAVRRTVLPRSRVMIWLVCISASCSATV